MIKNWVLEVSLKIVRWASSRVIWGGAFDEQVQCWWWWWMVRKVIQEKRVTSYPSFENILNSRCLWVMFFINKISLCKRAIKPWHLIIEHILALSLASSSNSTSLLLFQRRTSPPSKVGSLWTSTSSLGFPGGSLGHFGIAGAVMFICRPLRP